MNKNMAAVAAIFDLNTDLVLNCLQDVTDDVANQRLAGGGNSIAFLVAHLADSRFFIAHLLGSELANPLSSILDQANSIDDVTDLPSVTDLRQIWREVSAHLQRVLEAAADADLEQPTAQAYPVPGGTVKDAIAFLAQHDSYHVGQIAFLRRQFALPAMQYTRRSNAPVASPG